MQPDGARAEVIGAPSRLTSLLDQCLQAHQRAFPLRRDLVEIPPAIGKPLPVEFPDTFPSAATAMHESGLLHYPQVLSHGLTRYV